MMQPIRNYLAKDSGPFAQFTKYALAGGVATATHIVLFYAIGWRWLPSLTEDDIMVRLLGISPAIVEESRRAIHAAITAAAAFVIANAVAYGLNVLFVFDRGRHHWMVEIGLFYAVSAVAMFIGITFQSALIARYELMTTWAFGVNVLSALMINYAMRKFVIFK